MERTKKMDTRTGVRTDNHNANSVKSSILRKVAVLLCLPLFTILIFASPCLMVLGVAQRLDGLALVGWILLSPLTYSVVFIIVAGSLSLPHQPNVIEGVFPRDIGTKVYGARYLYGFCWTAVYYCKPVYFVALALPPLRTLTFRLFGYRGSMDFKIYPDTWIRDLPLLNLGPGAYVANRATLGTNIVRRSGDIAVQSIRVGAESMIGHLTMLAPGTIIGDNVSVGARCTVGYRVQIEERSIVGDCVGIDHQVTVGEGATIGSRAYLGRRSQILPGARIKPASHVHRKSSEPQVEEPSVATYPALFTRDGVVKKIKS